MLSSAEPVPRERLSRDCSLSQQPQFQNKPKDCVDMIRNASTTFTLLNILKQGQKICTNYGLPGRLCHVCSKCSAVTHHYYGPCSSPFYHFNQSDVGVYLWKGWPLASWDCPATTEKGCHITAISAPAHAALEQIHKMFNSGQNNQDKRHRKVPVIL